MTISEFTSGADNGVTPSSFVGYEPGEVHPKGVSHVEKDSRIEAARLRKEPFSGGQSHEAQKVHLRGKGWGNGNEPANLRFVLWFALHFTLPQFAALCSPYNPASPKNAYARRKRADNFDTRRPALKITAGEIHLRAEQITLEQFRLFIAGTSRPTIRDVTLLRRKSGRGYLFPPLLPSPNIVLDLKTAKVAK
jgi:hypothetical protein